MRWRDVFSWTTSLKPSTERFEHWFLRTRWLLAPFYVGVMFTLFLLLCKFCQHLIILIPQIFAIGEKDLILEVLSLVDLALVANLILMVAFVGYDQFVSSLGKVVAVGWCLGVCSLPFKRTSSSRAAMPEALSTAPL